MKRVTTLLTTLLILLVVTLGAQAATFKLSGSYENIISITSVDEFDDFKTLVLDDSVFSLNLNIKEKEVSLDLGVKNWTIDNFYNAIVPTSPDTADSIYLGITSPRFEGFYMQGYNEDYYYASVNDPMGIGNSIDNILSVYPDNVGYSSEYLQPINDLMWIGGNSVYINYGYPLAGIYTTSPLHAKYFDHFAHAKFEIGNETGRFNFDGYYIDSEIKYLIPSDEDIISVGSYIPDEIITDELSEERFYLSGPVLRATAEFSEYFVLGATFTNMNLTQVEDTSTVTDYLYTTLALDITGNIRFVGGQYFVSAMKTVVEDLTSSIKVGSDGLVFYTGVKNVPLGKYEQFRIGANYLLIPTDTHYFWGDSVIAEAMSIFADNTDDGIYKGEKIRKAGISLGITLGKVDVDVVNNMYFVENENGIQANTTNLSIVMESSEATYWNFNAYNVYLPGAYDDNLTINFDTAFKLGKYVTVGASTYNVFEMENMNSSVDIVSNGTSSFWSYVDFVAASGIIAESKLTLGGSVGYNYGNAIEAAKEKLFTETSLENQLGNFIYDAYVGVNLNLTHKARINGGIYVGRRLYEAYKYYEDYDFTTPTPPVPSTFVTDFISWNEPLIVGTLNAQYDISSVVTASVTGTYRGKEYMRVEESGSHVYKQFDPQYYAEAAVIVKPNDYSTIKFGWGFNGFSDTDLDGKANVKPWTYLKLPVDSKIASDWQRLTLDISIKF